MRQCTLPTGSSLPKIWLLSKGKSAGLCSPRWTAANRSAARRPFSNSTPAIRSYFMTPTGSDAPEFGRSTWPRHVQDREAFLIPHSCDMQRVPMALPEQLRRDVRSGVLHHDPDQGSAGEFTPSSTLLRVTSSAAAGVLASAFAIAPPCSAQATAWRRWRRPQWNLRLDAPHSFSHSPTPGCCPRPGSLETVRRRVTWCGRPPSERSSRPARHARGCLRLRRKNLRGHVDMPTRRPANTWILVIPEKSSFDWPLGTVF